MCLQADSLWYAPDGSPSTADKLLIQRLEVEAQLVARQGRCNSVSCGGAAELPPLDLSAAGAVGDGAQLSQVPPAFLCPISMQVRLCEDDCANQRADLGHSKEQLMLSGDWRGRGATGWLQHSAQQLEWVASGALCDRQCLPDKQGQGHVWR
jgi:hypothetical protein